MRASVLSGHELVGIEASDGEYGVVSVCTCGWQSTPAGSDHAHRRWQIHIDSTRAAAACLAAGRTMRQAEVRIEELTRLREMNRARRDAIREARGRLAAKHRNLRRPDAPTRYARPTLLESARQMAGLTFGNLWTAYFSLGGNLTPTELMAALRKATLLPHWDLNLIALALNEIFEEEGFGRPLDYWPREG